MDINLMVLNVGNTRTAFGVFVAGALEHVARVSNDDKDRWPEVIREAWSRIAGSESPAVAGASVNPGTMEALEHVVQRETGQKVEWVGREIDLPLRVLTDPPQETGVDRVVTMAA